MINFKQFLTEAKKLFALPPKIKENYKITSFNNVKNWKAKIILGNNGKDIPVGSYDDIGYVLISLDSNLIIPIGRCDEHQTGYELLEHLQKKKLVPNENFYSVCVISNNYIWELTPSNHKEALEAFTRFLQYGGDGNIKVVISSIQYKNKHYRVNTTISDFVEKGLDVEKFIPVKNVVSKKGQSLINDLETMAKANKHIHTTKLDTDKLKEKFVDNVELLLTRFKIDGAYEDISSVIYGTDISELREKFKNTKDFNIAEQIIFGMNGIKNNIHMKLKSFKDSTYEKDIYEDFFGDIEKALQIFNALSNI